MKGTLSDQLESSSSMCTWMGTWCIAAMLVYQWTNQSRPHLGAKCAHAPQPVCMSPYIVRRPVAGRSFALKKLG